MPILLLSKKSNLHIRGWAPIFFSLIILITGPLYSQSENWVYSFNGTDNLTDDGLSIVYGADQNIYIAGDTRHLDTNYDFFIMSLRYNKKTGPDTNWTFTIGGHGDETYDYANSIYYGPDENIYATGRIAIGSGDHAFTVVSLESNGSFNWMYMKSGSANGSDDAQAIAFDSENNLYVVGWLNDSVTSNDFVVISLDTLGNERWVYEYDGSAHQGDLGLDIIYGLDGNIYACGYTKQTETNYDWVVICLTPDGNEQWVWVDNLPGDGHCFSIVYGSDYRIYVAGEAYNPDNGSNDITVKSLDTRGRLKWAYSYDFAADYDCATSIIYGQDGNIYTSGYSAGITSYDAVIISFDKQGNERWVYRYDTTESMYEAVWSNMECDAFGNLYVGGTVCDFSSGNGDFLILSIDNRGKERWVYTYCGSSYTAGYCEAIDYGADGKIYIVGESDIGGYLFDITVICLNNNSFKTPFADKTTGTHEAEINQGNFSFGLRGNPCKNNVLFSLVLPSDAFLTLSIYDATGRLVDTPIKGEKFAGFYAIPWIKEMNAGIYFYKLESPWEERRGKLVLLK
jgi:hypothetical protein